MQIILIKVYYSTVFTVHINTYNVIQSLNVITVQIQWPTYRSFGNYTKVFIQKVKKVNKKQLNFLVIN